MTDQNGTVQWTENDSALFKELAPIAVPARAEQIAALLTLVPCAQDDTFHAVELASGEGYVSAALLQAFPNTTVMALDGSAQMRRMTQERLAQFDERGTVDAFDLTQSDWYPHLDDADFVFSSLCVHHLNGAEKQALFRAVYDRLAPNGAFIIADLVAPQRTEARQLFAETWDWAAEAQSIIHTGRLQLYQQFKVAKWNHYRTPDPIDQPSPLFDQLVWLREAGFAAVDCFWMRAGHAIYGGYKSATSNEAPRVRVSFQDAYDIAREVLATE